MKWLCVRNKSVEVASLIGQAIIQSWISNQNAVAGRRTAARPWIYILCVWCKWDGATMKHCVFHIPQIVSHIRAPAVADVTLDSLRSLRGSIIWFIGSVWFDGALALDTAVARGDNPASKLEIGRSPRRARVGGPFNWLLCERLQLVIGTFAD